MSVSKLLARIVAPSEADFAQKGFTDDEYSLHDHTYGITSIFPPPFLVMATDIVDKDLKELRNARWDKAFKTPMSLSTRENPQATVNRKATIVIEHLIQASDVAHTMQHWHVYRKWNDMFFEECY
jgi:hypothetical protein